MTPLGDGAVRVPIPAGTDRAAALTALRALPGVTDAVIAEETAAVFFDGPVDWSGFSWPLGTPRGRVHRLVVRYDGADLAEVADRTGLSVDEVVRRHQREYDVRFVGFLPGFAYMGDLDEALRIPRRPTPRTRVPAGAVAIAGARTGVYPLPSPGGWWLIGSADGPWMTADGARFRVGDRVAVTSA